MGISYVCSWVHSPSLTASWYGHGNMFSAGGAINTDVYLLTVGTIWLPQTPFSLFIFFFFSLFSYYTAITLWWARDPVGPTGSSLLGFALESSVKRTEDIFECILSNSRASNKWVTSTKCSVLISYFSPVDSNTFLICKLVIVWFCYLQPKNSVWFL